MSTDALRAEHDAVLSTLSTRASTKHFAHGAVTLFLALILLGTSGKLWWDYSTENPEWSAAAGALGAMVLGYCVVRFALGARMYGKERVQLTRLLDLRKTLGVDAPASLARVS